MGRVPSMGEIREAVLPLIGRHGFRSALLFGSYARGEAGPGSDVDILVDAGESFRPLSVYALGEELREATGKSVDVFELSELDEGPFRERAIGEAIRL